ncbi:hypothetical protein IX39_05895 [Chryseobacterium formosense]|uniref:Uncharacterized protein n=1 Tax=Chryseobacterium formosense TaxID=236814 RepID=A0A085Z6X4_9FLAO|nr:hypothetical protein [Chryseobacterium formosense]KFF00188.1 hypothetical protein IX39_05895 [Chryseobacterium formosense]
MTRLIFSVDKLNFVFHAKNHVRDTAGGDKGAGASEERTSTEAKRTPKQPDPKFCDGKNLIDF